MSESSSESVKGKHTPGEWKFLKEIGRVEAGKKIVCYLPGGVTAAEMEESIQNGPLIAAAPDLAKELSEILERPAIRQILGLNHRYETGCHCELCDAEAILRKAGIEL
jgi:hypothetical protein